MPKGVAANAGSLGLGSPFSTALTLSWDVTFPDNARHTLGVSVAGTGGTGFLSLTDGPINAQENLG